jgi:hypothetical protein
MRLKMVLTTSRRPDASNAIALVVLNVPPSAGLDEPVRHEVVQFAKPGTTDETPRPKARSGETEASAAGTNAMARAVTMKRRNMC